MGQVNVSQAKVPLVDLQAQYRSIKPEIDAAIAGVLERGTFVLGPEVEAFEKESAAYCGTEHGIGVASGTDALELILRAYGIGPGDEVITPAYSFVATALAVVLVGAKPVFVDVEPETCNIDAKLLRKAITPRTKAIIAVHLYGHPFDVTPVAAIAKEAKVKLVEDCAQAIGAIANGKRVGSFGDAAAFSFYPSKNLGAYGDGGLVVTSDRSLAERLRALRWYGSADRTTVTELGRNSRLDELQAAILRVKLRHIERWNAARAKHAEKYTELFKQRALNRAVFPLQRPGCRHVYHLYPLRIPGRDALRQALQKQGIATQVHYSYTLAEQPVLAKIAGAGSFPVAESIARTVLSLPLYPELTDAQIATVVDAVSGALPS